MIAPKSLRAALALWFVILLTLSAIGSLLPTERAQAASWSATSLTVTLTGTPPSGATVKADRTPPLGQQNIKDSYALTAKGNNVFSIDSGKIEGTGDCFSSDYESENGFTVKAFSGTQILGQKTVEIQCGQNNRIDISVSSTPQTVGTLSGKIYCEQAIGGSVVAAGSLNYWFYKKGSSRPSASTPDDLDAGTGYELKDKPTGTYVFEGNVSNQSTASSLDRCNGVFSSDNVLIENGKTTSLFITVHENGDPATLSATDPGSGGGSGAGTGDDSCESAGGVLGWIGCPIINLFDGTLNWLDTQIQSMLAVDEDKYTNPELRTAWASFRNISYIVLIPIMLIMVIGTALGFEVMSAYTVKRALPRMGIAVIFITFSWYITGFLIGFFNVIGAGILGLMTSPFGIQGNMNLSSLFDADAGVSGLASAGIQWAGASVMLLALAALITIPGGLGILLLYLGMAALIVFSAFLILTLRQLMIIALILLAPLAILAWIFPGNDKLWKLWWGTFSKLLIMFPLIMVIIGAGRIFAHLIDISGGGGVESIINPLLKLTAYILPYLFIPLTFKFAGGLVGNLAGVINDRERGLFDRMKKSRNERWGDLNERRHNGNLYKKAPEGSRRARINSRVERLSNIGKAGLALDRDVRRARIDSALGTADLNAAREAMQKNPELSVLLGNEDYAEAGRSGRGFVRDAQGNFVLNAAGQRIRRDGSENAVRAFLNSRGYGEEDVQSVMHARGSMSQNAFNIAAVLSIPPTGTGFAGGAGEMDAAINETVGDNRRLAATMLAEMRGSAERAGRVDLKGGGFGSRRTAMEAQYNAELRAEENARRLGTEVDYTAAQAATTREVTERAIFSSDARTVMASKPKIIGERFVPVLREQLEAAINSGDQARIDQELAKVAALYDQAAQVSPEAAQQVANGLMSLQFAMAGPDGERDEVRSVREAIDEARTRPARHGIQGFLDLRREYGSRFEAADAAARNEDAARRAAEAAEEEARRAGGH